MIRSTRLPGNGFRTRASVPIPGPSSSSTQISATSSVAGPSKPRRAATTIPVVETASTLLAIAKDVGEMLRGVPYVKAVCGVVLKIIEINEEVANNKWRCKELVERVVRRSEVIFSGLKKIADAPGRDGLKDLENDLLAYDK
ncbi:hypothetical protein C8F01DRAFT_497227 [Mycena amicta]|nr:hypothetical protein C8F01DRAFT_497227 [Mycena amicta]